jgi:2,3-dimethylmalate lyase
MEPSSSRNGSMAVAIHDGQFFWAPGVFDGFSTMMAHRSSAPALYIGGYCVAASRYGLPDAGLVGLNDMLAVIELVAGLTTKPIIADADTGFGGLLNVQRTVREYERLGVQAIQIEDQEVPKKCGHTAAKRVIAVDEMCAKVSVAVESRRYDSTLIIGRTDSREVHGLDDAICRGLAYRHAGADVVFIEAPHDADEVRQICRAIPGPLMINMAPRSTGFVGVELGRSELARLGISIAVYPGLLAGPSLGAMEHELTYLTHNETPLGVLTPSVNVHEMVGFGPVQSDERRWSERFGRRDESSP